ncbi:hypothetical protein K504DRAFT_211322 [Pleomassaria siparia CBS 279.74]|uniref:Uncharacterized protein n=1 Tax=Pleomassaria siparia CBS 279.74 TaxID=1314801 RepID=A0A6G1KIY1_9PLEO|nr:hypothetical protein K504DRAFT_211322 [Pleomassaria siparia CBS 279.74]
MSACLESGPRRGQVRIPGVSLVVLDVEHQAKLTCRTWLLLGTTCRKRLKAEFARVDVTTKKTLYLIYMSCAGWIYMGEVGGGLLSEEGPSWN